MLVARTGGRYTQQDWYAEARKEESKEQEMRRRGERTTIISGGRERKREKERERETGLCLEADDTQG